MQIHFKHIFVEKEAWGDLVTQQILSNYKSPTQIKTVNSIDEILKEGFNPKEVLFLAHHKGEIVKECPGIVPGNICCRYYVINQTLNCPLNCSYCVLQDYLNQPATIIYTDFDQILNEIYTLVSKSPQRFFRLGTGELGDSLALNGSQYFAKLLIEKFAEIPNAIIELKTKVAQIDQFLNLNHKGHTVFAWSLNAPEIIKKEEKGAAVLKARLKAAQKAQEAGYLLAFHFDPLILFPEAEKEYCKVVDEIFKHVSSDRIVWISFGSLRFPPELEDKIKKRHPHSRILPAEMVRGVDGKMRYFRPLRAKLYKALLNRIRYYNPDLFVYLCMETPLVWEEVMGFAPKDNAELDFMFAESIYKRFPYLIPNPPQQEDYRAD